MKFQIICSLLALAVAANANPWPNFFFRSNQNGQPAVNPPSVNPPSIDPQSMNLPSMNLPSMDPQSMNLPSMNLPKVDLPSMDPPSMNLPSINLPKVDPQSMNLPSINLPKVDLPSINLPKVDLPSMDPKSINLPSVDLPSMDPKLMNLPSMGLKSMNKQQVPRQLGDCPIKAALIKLFPFLNQFETPANIERLIKSIFEDLQLVSSRVAKKLNNLPTEVQNDVQNALDALQKIVDDLISSLKELVTLIANATSLEGINDLVSFLTSNITKPLRSALGLVQTIAANVQIPENQLLGNTFKALSALVRGLLKDVLKIPGLVTRLVGRLLSGNSLSNLNSILSWDFSSLFGSSIGGSAGLGNSAGLRRSASLGSSRMSISPISFWDDLASEALNQVG